MPLTLVDNYVFGGVDSRSNPLNMPRNRSIRCRNWVVAEGGWLQLRQGYAEISQSTLTATAIHSMADYQLWAGTRYLLYGQGTTLRRFAMSGGTTTTLATLSSSSNWDSYIAFNRIFLGNGTDMKSYDGTTLRNIGIRAPSSSEYSSVVAYALTRTLTTAEAAAVTITQTAAATSFPVTAVGYQWYVAHYTASTNSVSPFMAVGTRTTNAAGTRFDFASLPTTYSVKIYARTTDGGGTPKIVVNAAPVTITSVSRTGGVLTVNTSTNHGYSVGNTAIVIKMTSDADGALFNGVYVISTTPTTTQFTCSTLFQDTQSGGAGQTARAAETATATATAQISTTQTLLEIGSTWGGLAAASTTGADSGYQVYMAYYNPTTGQVGNCVKVGGRISYSTAGYWGRIDNLPSLSGVDSEWVKLFGRTADGGQIPYVITDSGGNWQYAGNTDGNFDLKWFDLDYNHELPTHNGVPTGMDKFARVGDRIYGNPPNSPYIYRSGNEADSRAGTFTGRPEESWHSSDVETFPTGQPVTSLQEYEYECWAFTLNDCAALSDLSGVLVWRGPYNIGCAGQRAFVRTHYGPFFLTGEKQLAVVTNQGPMVISGEYEAALLAKIGDSYLTATELTYYRDPAYNIDHIKIKARDSSGDPFVVIHDFRLRDDQSPFGQAYEQVYVGALASNFTTASVRNSNGTRRIWAGGSDGRLYDLDSGASDNGTQFSADYIALVNFGNQRPGLEEVEFQGDQNTTISYLTELNRSLTDFPAAGITEVVPGWDTSYLYRTMNLLPEVKTAYVRFQLTSHSSDGNTALGSTPHVPLETYGRIWCAKLGITNLRGETT